MRWKGNGQNLTSGDRHLKRAVIHLTSIEFRRGLNFHQTSHHSIARSTIFWKCSKMFKIVFGNEDRGFLNPHPLKWGTLTEAENVQLAIRCASQDGKYVRQPDTVKKSESKVSTWRTFFQLFSSFMSSDIFRQTWQAFSKQQKGTLCENYCSLSCQRLVDAII